MVKVSLVIAFVGGFLSFVSPCVLPMVPGYLAFISGVSVERLKKGEFDARDRARLLGNSLLFILGFSIVFIVLGLALGEAGDLLKYGRLTFLKDATGHLRMMLTSQTYFPDELQLTEVFKIGFQQVLGVLVIIFALDRLGLFKIPFLAMQGQTNLLKKPASFLGTVLVGSAFAISWSPCVGPILGGIFSMTVSEHNLWERPVLLVVYSAGLAVPFLAAALGMNYFFKFLKKAPRLYRGLEILTGALLFLIGYLVFTDKMASLNQYFQSLNGVWNTSSLEDKLLGR